MSRASGDEAARWVRWRRLSVRRALLLIFVGFVVFCATGLLIGVAGDRQERLEHDGVRTPGTVVRTSHPIRGPDSVLVDYEFAGQQYALRIYASEHYDVGEVVTVLVDPGDPRSATLPDEQPQSAPTYWLTIFLILGSCILAFAGVRDLWRLWRRRRS